MFFSEENIEQGNETKRQSIVMNIIIVLEIKSNRLLERNNWALATISHFVVITNALLADSSFSIDVVNLQPKVWDIWMFDDYFVIIVYYIELHMTKHWIDMIMEPVQSNARFSFKLLFWAHLKNKLYLFYLHEIF